MPRLQWRNFGSGLWLKGPRENNPPGTLRRAKSVYPLRTGSIRSRSGSALISSLVAHSLFKYAGKRIAGVGTSIYREVVGVFTQLVTGVPTLDGTRLTFVAAPPTVGKDDSVFVAGGGNLFKINPALDTASKWGIVPPLGTAPSAALAAQSTKTIDTMDVTAGWTASVIDDDDTDVTATFPPGLAAVAGKKIEGAASLRFKAFKDHTTRIDKLIVLDLNQFAAPNDSGDEDYIELYIAFNHPKHVKNMEVVFYVGAGAPTFDDETDTYSRELTFKVVKDRRKRKLVGTGDIIRPKDIAAFIADGRLDTINFSMAEFVSQDKIGVTRRTWTRVTLPKASFIANGNAGTAGKTWANVQAVRISVETTKQGGSRVWLDRIRMIGGVGMQGDYQYMFTLRNSTTGTRSNPFPTAADSVTGATVFSPVRINNVERQPVDLTNLQNMLPQADGQVDKIEVWRTVGNGTSFFLVDEVAVASASYTDRVADVPGLFSGGGGTKFLQPIELPDDNDRPKDTTEDVVGPVFGRLFLCNRLDNRVWYSPVGRLEAAPSYAEVGAQSVIAAGTDFPIVAAPTANEIVEKLVVWNEQLFAFTNHGFYRCVTTDEPFVFVQVLGVRGTVRPGTVRATPVGIVYQANDGIRLFDGAMSELIADDALSPIFRGSSTDGLSAFSGVVSEYARNEYYVSDDSTTTLAFSPDGGWRDLGIPCKALFYEDDTGILLATAQMIAPLKSAIIIRKTGNLAVNNTTSGFVSFGSEVAGSHTAARSLVPLALTLVSMRVLLSAALGGGGTVQFRVNINGTPQATLSITIASGGSTGSATGSLAIADGDFVSIETTFAGGSTAASVQAISLGYTVP